MDGNDLEAGSYNVTDHSITNKLMDKQIIINELIFDRFN